ncbi:MAG TPA: 3-methyl-2-oxobutanoate dehydrogenase subunit beta [Elusimicrobia bacterium]|nr:MAG: 3-methyl-2-oxobutanoate dehydrogenase subunit VorB [Elusimicrobia bacterium RIFOXYA12_FULL_49_49]OGS09828.1 MAG: 3-methyl-2-oxobutanoate dehydrogenase subunit VorB [Elusimicrobia bacterium RIFOXYB1_FULL_48_9]OGS16353.1 MAG: 3-methyl-2-oxobutanoate dehydrogenase subunit VorB [Elusimicrobia bacterium RIFOXYA2_FULL_47_53]OGS27266.1 MAG: 3-methyl-2-oxobutanoate dehydrogenase subunit VorB [Elusimicrobia bacterium RIFOXYB12_FULL_50_12]OGS30469.1 MAG: 3-methyl-2-oxobutanoate dehydrogenase subu
MKKTLMKGNIALCEGAIAAGCKAYFGYPITPQNEVPAHMSKRMPELGLVFLQAESEVAAINMVLGASATGVRVMTSSSSPGVSLKQEGISYLVGCELPAVIVNVQRGGPGLGNISGSQADYFQATKGGGHGDYRMIVLAPSSVQDMYDHTMLAFDLADKYRTPVMLLADGVVGQMMEPLMLNKYIPAATGDRSWVLDGARGREPRSVKSLLMAEGALERHNLELRKKFDLIEANETRIETKNTDDAEIIIVAFGISARVAYSTMRALRAAGKKIGVARPVTLWPFPQKTISELAKPGRKFLVAEMNMGQMVEDVRLAVNGKCPVEFYGRPGGGLVNQEEMIERINKM